MCSKILILLTAFFLSNSTFGQFQNFQFKHITIDQGLSSNRVHSFGQDKNGFIWIGTPEGLQRFDGYEFKTFHTRAHYGQSPLFEDNHGNLWMICEGCEVYKLDLETEDIENYPSVGNLTWDLYHDDEGIIWAITKGFGIAKYVHEADTFITYKHDPDDNYSINCDYISVIYKDSKKNVWIGTQKGLNLFDVENEYFREFRDGPKVTVLDIEEDQEGILWLATINGLYKFNPNNGKFTHHHYDNLKKIEFIYIDSNNNIWLVTNLGILSFDQFESKFISYPNYSKNKRLDYGISLEPILEREDGSLWSVANRRLSLYDPSINDFIFFHPNPNNIYSVNDALFCNIFEDKSRNLWIGTMSGGINYIPGFTKKFTFFPKKSVTTLYV
ncbi:MAG: two-component regulator propeller domain-containing protein, partial [Melioribacteraceae bacterium]|nr:two-component regulator propeller domain-containing protein [Melioribacteraceae bacterium]